MKIVILFTILFLGAVLAEQPPQQQISIPQKCEDVLSVKACDKIKSMAENVKLKAQDARDAFVNAWRKGKQTTEDIIASVEKFYLEKVKSKKCEDFTSVENCKSLRLVGEKIKIKAEEFEVFIKKAVIAGKKKTQELYAKVLDYYRNEIKGKTCEELLSKTPKVCTTLRTAANALKIKVEQLNKIVREAVINGYNNATALVKRGINKLKEYAANFKCEDLLSVGLCKALREYSAKLKVAFPKIMATVRDLLVKGYSIAKGFLKAVYKITDAFIDCEHIFTAKSCKLLKEKITAVGGKLRDIGTAVRDIAIKVVNKAKDVYKTVLNYTKSKLCKHLGLGCPKPANAIVKRSLGFKELFNKYKEMLKKGIAEAKAKLVASLNSLLSSMKIVDKTIRDVMKQAIEDGKMKYNELKALLKKLVDAATGKTNTTTTDVNKTKRDVKIHLKSALSEAHTSLRAAIEYLLTRTKQELQKMHNYVSSLLKRVFGTSIVKRDADDDMLDAVADTLVDEQTAELTLEAEEIADGLLDDVIAEVEEDAETLIEETSMQKRDLTSGVSKVKELFGKIGDKMKELFSKLKSTSLEDIKAALKKAGSKLIGVAEDIYKQIKEALENQSDEEF